MSARKSPEAAGIARLDRSWQQVSTGLDAGADAANDSDRQIFWILRMLLATRGSVLCRSSLVVSDLVS